MKVRIVRINGEPWFVAADVCRALELTSSRGSYSNHLLKLDPDEKRIVTVGDLVGPAANSWSPTGGLNPHTRMSLVSESGLYTLIFRSQKPEAVQFRKWVTREVLPAIRKDGAYLMGEEKVRTGEMSEDEFSRAMASAQAILERR